MIPNYEPDILLPGGKGAGTFTGQRADRLGAQHYHY